MCNKAITVIQTEQQVTVILALLSLQLDRHFNSACTNTAVCSSSFTAIKFLAPLLCSVPFHLLFWHKHFCSFTRNQIRKWQRFSLLLVAGQSSFPDLILTMRIYAGHVVVGGGAAPFSASASLY